MPTSYIPRGYISTPQALARLFEARQADLVPSASEREAEERQLFRRRTSSNAAPPPPINVRRPKTVDSGPVEFAEEDARCLEEPATIGSQMHSLRLAAANDIRTALAEGDLSAILLTGGGCDEAISRSTWRAKDGLNRVRSGRVRIQLPSAVGFTEGQALIKGADFITWLASTGAPRKFSQVTVSVLVQDRTQRARTAPSVPQQRTSNDSSGGRKQSASVAPLAAPAGAGFVTKRRDIKRTDHRHADAKLMPKMDELLGRGEARSPYDAGIVVSGEAAGTGKVESKAKRLADRYKEWKASGAGASATTEHD